MDTQDEEELESVVCSQMCVADEDVALFVCTGP